MGQIEASIRGIAAAWLRDVSPYVGLTLDEARGRAESTKDFLCVHTGAGSTERTHGLTVCTLISVPTGACRLRGSTTHRRGTSERHRSTGRAGVRR
jgi:hypothetical protein